MGFISNLAKAGIAKKVFSIASKPENQAKAKSALSSARGRSGKATTRRGETTGRGRRSAAAGSGRRARVVSKRSGAPRR